MDDGSTDSTPKLLNKFAVTDSRVKILRENNGGVSKARNKGIDASKGSFIAFVDSDDWVNETYFECLMNAQNKADADVVICDAENVRLFTEKPKVVFGEDVVLMNINDIVKRSTYIKSRVWGRVYKRKIIENTRFPENISLGEDTIFNLKVLLDKDDIKITYIDEQLYYYFEREGSLVKTFHVKNLRLKGKWFVENFDAMNKTGKSVFLNEAFKSFWAWRYMSMFSEDKKEVDTEADINLKKCIKLMRDVPSLSAKRKIILLLFSEIPMLYRMYRICTDRTMLVWERNMKNNKKEKQKKVSKYGKD